MKVKIKKLHEKAVTPKYAKPGDAGLDLTAVSKSYDRHNIVYGTGLAIQIPDGHVGLLFPRSSITNTTLSLGNAVGVIDSGYRGEITFKFRDHPYNSFTDKEYQINDRIGQLLIIPYPQIELVEAEELDSTERGNSGYGSSGS